MVVFERKLSIEVEVIASAAVGLEGARYDLLPKLLFDKWIQDLGNISPTREEGQERKREREWERKRGHSPGE